MENAQPQGPQEEHDDRFIQGNRQRSRVAGGLLLIIIGGLFLYRELNPGILPDWLFSWKMLLVVIGLHIGISNGLRGFFWLWMIAGGLALAIGDTYPQLHLRTIGWPVLVILIGISFLLRPKQRFRHYKHKHYHRRYQEAYRNKWMDEGEAPQTHEDYIEVVSVFGQIKKNSISKSFKGGDVVALFGGAKINLSQADIEDTAYLELTAVFGGVQLVVPPHWKIKSDATAVFGGIDDKRQSSQDFSGGPEKTLVLQGTVFMGGIEIRSF